MRSRKNNTGKTYGSFDDVKKHNIIDIIPDKSGDYSLIFTQELFQSASPIIFFDAENEIDIAKITFNTTQFLLEGYETASLYLSFSENSYFQDYQFNHPKGRLVFESNLTTEQLKIEANRVQNNSLLKSDNLQLHATNYFINPATAQIYAQNQLYLTGGSVWNAGKIIAPGKNVISLNYFFVHGVSSLELLKQTVENKQWPCGAVIQGGDFSITAGAYINLLSLISVRNWTLMAIAEINIGIGAAVNTNKARLISLDCGIDVPNLSQIINDILPGVLLIGQGEFSKCFKELDKTRALVKSTSFARWVLRTFLPASGKPIDMAWTAAMLLFNLPTAYSQCQAIYTKSRQNQSIEPRDIYGLLALAGSVTNQVFFLETQLDEWQHETRSYPFQLQWPTQAIPFLMLDIAALFAPTQTDDAILKIKSGIHVTGSSLDRSFMTYSTGQVTAALNISNLFDMSIQHYTIQAANHISEIGRTLVQQSAIFSNNHFMNTISQYTTNYIYTNQLVWQTKLYQDDSAINVQQAMFMSNNSGIHKGLLESNTAVFNGNILLFSPDCSIKTDVMTIQSQHYVQQGKIEANHIYLKADSNIQLEKTAVITSHRFLAEAPMITQSGHIIIQPDPETTSNKTDLYFEATEFIHHEASSHIDAKEAVIFFNSKQNIIDAGYIRSKHVLFNAEQKIQQLETAVIEAEKSIFVYAKEDLSMLGQLAAQTVLYQAPQATLQGSVEADNIIHKIDQTNSDTVIQLLTQSGSYQQWHPKKVLAIETTQSIQLQGSYDFPYSVFLKSPTMMINSFLHTSGSFNFMADAGDMSIQQASITADQQLLFDVQGSCFVTDSTLKADEIQMIATGHFINQHSTLQSDTYLYLDINGNLEIHCAESIYQGEYGQRVDYLPGQLLGGTGRGYKNIGLNIRAGGNFLLDSSNIISTGTNQIVAEGGGMAVSTTARSHEYTSYEKDFSNAWQESYHIIRDWESYASVIQSVGNTVIQSTYGSIDCLSTEITAVGQIFMIALGKDVVLRELILDSEDYITHKNGFTSDSSDSHDQSSRPTRVRSIAGVNIYAVNDIRIEGAQIQSVGKVTLTAGHDIIISAPLLDHSVESDHLDTDIQLLNCPLLSLDTIYEEAKELKTSSGYKMTATLGKLWSSGQDTLNSFHGIMSELYSGSTVSSIVSNIFSTMTAKITVTHTETKIHGQTVDHGTDIECGTLKMHAGNTVAILNGVSVDVQGNAHIEAHHLILQGAELDADNNTTANTLSVGLSGSGDPELSIEHKQSHIHSTTYVNQHLRVGGTLTLNVDECDMQDANIHAHRLAGRIGHLSMISDCDSMSSDSRDIAVDTAGNIHFQENHHHHSRGIGKASGISAQHSRLRIGDAAVRSHISPHSLHGQSLFKDNRDRDKLRRDNPAVLMHQGRRPHFPLTSLRE